MKYLWTIMLCLFVWHAEPAAATLKVKAKIGGYRVSVIQPSGGLATDELKASEFSGSGDTVEEGKEALKFVDERSAQFLIQNQKAHEAALTKLVTPYFSAPPRVVERPVFIDRPRYYPVPVTPPFVLTPPPTVIMPPGPAHSNLAGRWECRPDGWWFITPVDKWKLVNGTLPVSMPINTFLTLHGVTTFVGGVRHFEIPAMGIVLLSP